MSNEAALAHHESQQEVWDRQYFSDAQECRDEVKELSFSDLHTLYPKALDYIDYSNRFVEVMSAESDDGLKYFMEKATDEMRAVAWVFEMDKRGRHGVDPASYHSVELS